VQNGQFDLFLQETEDDEVELTSLNWLETLEKHVSPNLEIIIRKTSTSKPPAITLSEPTDLKPAVGILEAPHPSKQAAAESQLLSANKETNRASEIQRRSSLQGTLINTAKDKPLEASSKSPFGLLAAKIPDPSPEEFANSLGADKHKIIPFFQWRLRKASQKSEEKTKVGRSRIVLRMIWPRLLETYRESLYSKGLISNELYLESLKQLSKLEGMTVDQFIEETIDGTSRNNIQLDILLETTSAVLNLFLPNIIGRDAEPGPPHPPTRETTVNPADAQSNESRNLIPTRSLLGQRRGNNRDEDVVAEQAIVNDPGSSVITGGTSPAADTLAGEHDLSFQVESHPTLQLFRAVLAGVILVSWPPPAEIGFLR